jgi:hypothetical protein
MCSNGSARLSKRYEASTHPNTPKTNNTRTRAFMVNARNA